MRVNAAAALDHPTYREDGMTMKPTMPERTATAAEPAPICVACIGGRTNPHGGRCLRCHGSGIDPDPLAPTGIAVAS